MQTLTKTVNRYRTMQVNFLSFPMNPETLTIESYTKNNGQSKMKGLDVFNFDTISYLSTSELGYIHAVGLNGGKLVQLVMKEKV